MTRIILSFRFQFGDQFVLLIFNFLRLNDQLAYSFSKRELKKIKEINK